MTLRIGLIIEKDNIESWFLEILSGLTSSEEFDPIVLVASPYTPSTNAPNPIDKMRSALKRIYSKTVEKRAYLRDATEDQNPIPRDVECIKLNATEDILNHKNCVDFCITTHLVKDRYDLRPLTKHGVISFHEGYSSQCDADLIGIWESIRRSPTKSCHLLYSPSLSKSNYLIKKSNTFRHKLSLRDSRNATLWKATTMILATLETIKEHHLTNKLDKFEQSLSEIDITQIPTQPQPNLFALAYFVFSQLVFKFYTVTINHICREKWFILYSSNSSSPLNFKKKDYQKISSPPDLFWADPFIWKNGGENYVFFEEYSYETGRAHISAGKLSDGKIIDVHPVIKHNYHMSYPYLFESDNQLYMIPESGENQTVDLYECEEFPYKWKLKKTLLENVRAYDVSLTYIHDSWWMFANIVNVDGASDWEDLHLFYSDSLLNGTWKEHPQNPVVSDCRRSRPAGAPFYLEGELIRPSQNSSKKYGGALNFNKIIELNKENYKEELTKEISPPFGLCNTGIHTFNQSQDYIVIDGRFRTLF